MQNMTLKKSYKKSSTPKGNNAKKVGHTKKPGIPKEKYDVISPKLDEQLKKLSPNSELVIKLTPEQVVHIQTYYNYTITPRIYRIDTIKKLPYSPHSPKAIIKQLQKASQAGHSHINRPLNQEDIKTLNDYGVNYSPNKYAITTRAT